MKIASVTGAFGKDFQMVVSKGSDIGDLGRKIDVLIKFAQQSQFLKRLQNAKERFAKTRINDDIE
jgi:hypothetical protein